MKKTQINHALGALRGLALGDALGMPTQSMSVTQIYHTYGTVTGLMDASSTQPIAPGMPAGHVTDDTEQALLIASLIAQGHGHIDPYLLAQRLLVWEDGMKARGSHDLLGPSTKLALEQVRAGADITTTGRTGTTNGAAMRVAPVGIAHSAVLLTEGVSSATRTNPEFADYVYESCRVTHNTETGFLSALLVAAAVSLGVAGLPVRIALEQALSIAESTAMRGAWSPKANVVSKARQGIRLARAVADSEISADAFNLHAEQLGEIADTQVTRELELEEHRSLDRAFIEVLRENFGTSVEADESVAVSFALAWRYADEPLKALLGAANIGGDTDTIASIAGAMLGAAAGADAFPLDLTSTVERVSQLNLEAVAASLVDIRRGEWKV